MYAWLCYIANRKKSAQKNLKVVLSDKPDKILYEICLLVRKSDKRIGKLFVKRGLTFAVSQQLHGCKIKRITNFVDG